MITWNTASLDQEQETVGQMKQAKKAAPEEKQTVDVIHHRGVVRHDQGTAMADELTPMRKNPNDCFQLKIVDMPLSFHWCPERPEAASWRRWVPVH